jgi:hypothetical protein
LIGAGAVGDPDCAGDDLAAGKGEWDAFAEPVGHLEPWLGGLRRQFLVTLAARLGRGMCRGLRCRVRHSRRLRSFDNKLRARMSSHCQAYESRQNQMSHGTIPKILRNPPLESCERGCGTPAAQTISLLLGLSGWTDSSAGAGACAASTGSQRKAFKSLRPLTGEDDFCR